MTVVLRVLFVLPFGFLLSCLAGAFALLWPFLDLPPNAVRDPLVLFEIAVVFAAQTAQVGSTALLPWALFALLTEVFALSSLLLHMAAGLLGGFAVTRLAYPGVPAAASIQTALMVAGLSFSLVYWLVAGRGAGRWRKRRAPVAPGPLAAPSAERTPP